MGRRHGLDIEEGAHLLYLATHLRAANPSERTFWLDRMGQELAHHRSNGTSWDAIADAAATSRSTVRRWWERWTSITKVQSVHVPASLLPANYEHRADTGPDRPFVHKQPDGLTEMLPSVELGEQNLRTSHGSNLRSSPLVAMFGPGGPHRRFDLEANALRRAARAVGVTPVELTGVDLIELRATVDLYRPRVLHVAAHVDDMGVWMVEDHRDAPVSWGLLFEQLDLVEAMPDLVVFSCCQSAAAAGAIAERWGRRAIGCNGQVPDDAARLFARTLYERWANGLASSFGSLLDAAFRDANLRIQANHPETSWSYHLY